jgi:predicted PolB exonuclease-like 3'-5' exonuclease
MNYLIFDIETRVDKSLLRQILFPHESIDDEEAFRRAREQIRRETDGRSDFLAASFHVPVSIAFGCTSDDGVLDEVTVLKADTMGEAGVVRDFWRRLDGFQGTLVSFNGRAFDLPVLEWQAIRHRCSAPRYFGERNGFRVRFGRHLDLYDFLTNHGATRLRGGLNLLARLLGLPGKVDVSGADVQGLWEGGQFDVVHRYCARDVIQTYFLLLHVEHLRGRLSDDELRRIEDRTAPLRVSLRETAEEEA